MKSRGLKLQGPAPLAASRRNFRGALHSGREVAGFQQHNVLIDAELEFAHRRLELGAELSLFKWHLKLTLQLTAHLTTFSSARRSEDP